MFFGVEGPLFIVQAIFPKEYVSVSDFGMLIVSSLGHNIKHIRKALKRALNIIVWNFFFEVLISKSPRGPVKRFTANCIVCRPYKNENIEYHGDILSISDLLKCQG